MADTFSYVIQTQYNIERSQTILTFLSPWRSRQCHKGNNTYRLYYSDNSLFAIVTQQWTAKFSLATLQQSHNVVRSLPPRW